MVEPALITSHGCLGFSDLWLKNTAAGMCATIQRITHLSLPAVSCPVSPINEFITQIYMEIKPLAFPIFL